MWGSTPLARKRTGIASTMWRRAGARPGADDRPFGHRHGALGYRATFGVPLYVLLGGPSGYNLRVDFTHWDASIPTGKRDIAAVTELAARTREQGWTAVKYTLPLAATELERIDQDVAELAAIREVFGTQADIALECAETFTVRSAIQFANAIAPYHPLFMEEPTLRRIPRPWEVAAKSPVPLPPARDFSRVSSSNNCST